MFVSGGIQPWEVRGRLSINRSGDPGPLAFPLPPSSSVKDPADLAHSSVRNPHEIHAFFHNDENSSSDDSTISSSSVRIQPPATTGIALTAPSSDRTVQASPAIPPHSTSAPGPDSDEDDEETPGLYIPALIAPTVLLPIRTPLVILQASVHLVAIETH